MDRKWRIEKLKSKIVKKQDNTYTQLFQECLEALGEGPLCFQRTKVKNSIRKSKQFPLLQPGEELIGKTFIRFRNSIILMMLW
jgi:hypothetical protein